MRTIRYVVGAVDSFITKLVSTLVISVLLTMVGLAFLQVVLRNFFSTGLPWVDVVLRNLVLWLGLLGGILATRKGRQINIDLLARVKKRSWRTLSSWLGGIFTIIVCYYLARASLVFISSEKEFGTVLYGQTPNWYAQIILPVGFSLIGFQVLLNLMLGRTFIEAELQGEAATPSSGDNLQLDDPDEEEGESSLGEEDEP